MSEELDLLAAVRSLQQARGKSVCAETRDGLKIEGLLLSLSFTELKIFVTGGTIQLEMGALAKLVVLP